MTPAAAKRLRLLASAVTVLLAVAVLGAGWFYGRLRASLPQVEGRATLGGLGTPVEVTRDALGIPTIRARDQGDAMRALGWLHAQDRFFQMDLLRRSSAGELAELFGTQALPRDRQVRMHGFRRLAEKIVEGLPAADRARLDAYTAGVNAGLAALAARPFEYLVLRTSPEPWRPADTVLVLYAMTLDLQDGSGRHERTLMTLRDQLGRDALAFFDPLITPDDAALDGSTAPLPPIPGPRVLDLRGRKISALWPAAPDESPGPHLPFAPRPAEFVLGSNAFAVDGAHSATGAAVVANDMHLELRVPNTWYRAALQWPAADGSPAVSVSGVTLPGAPGVVVGSNGRIAWGFTNSYTDVSDLVVVETLPDLPEDYHAPGQADALRFEKRVEMIKVKGGDDVRVEYPWTIWGPIVGRSETGQPLALRWVAHEPAAANLGIFRLESAGTVAEAVAVAHRAGMPAQNLVVGDTTGAIAWTIAGRLPNRRGYDGRLPVSWRFGDRAWDGLLDPDRVPVLASPLLPGSGPLPEGRIWSANQRHVGGEALRLVGDGDYARPYRAAQCREGLLRVDRAKPADLLAVQLDDRALFLERWHRRLLQTLSPAAVAGKPAREELRRHIERWEGRAGPEAVSYRIVREFRIAAYARIYRPIFAGCTEAFPGFAWNQLQLEPATWALLDQKPAHLLESAYADWDALLLAAADDVITKLGKDGKSLPQANWGWQNTARIRHPFGNLLPGWVAGWLNMAEEPLAGSDDMPRAQTPSHGASERMAVSPGREAEGILHVPGGQSGHPLSPFYRAGHEAWVRGLPTPFLPGVPAHTLVLAP